jgi:hypothetical protein
MERGWDLKNKVNLSRRLPGSNLTNLAVLKGRFEIKSPFCYWLNMRYNIVCMLGW